MPNLKPCFRSTSAVARWLLNTASYCGLAIAWSGSALHANEPAPPEIPSPTFGSGSVSDLQVAVVQVKSTSEYSNLLTVEVTNRGNISAEPLVFRIELPGKKPTTQNASKGKASKPLESVTRFARADLPHFQRFGRPTPPGGKQRYYLQALAGKKAEYKISVETASFFEGGEVAKPALRISTPKSIQLPTFQGDVAGSELTVDNPLDCELDALFLVTFSQPRDTTDLLGVHLPAAASHRWIIGSMGLFPIEGGGPLFPVASDSPVSPTKVTKVELVDWSSVAPADEAAGLAIFEEAYRNWLRWPDPQPVVAGEFAYHARRPRLTNLSEYDSFEVKGRFTLDEQNKVKIEMLSGGGANANHIIQRAFKNLRRESLETVIAENDIIPIGPDTVEIRGPGFGDDRSEGRKLQATDEPQAGRADFYRVRDGRIIAAGFSATATSRALDDVEEWETTSVADGYLITQTRKGESRFTCSYSNIDGLTMPIHVKQVTKSGIVLVSEEEISFSNLTTSGVTPIEPKPPSGPGADALRSIWNESWRLTTEPIVIHAKFEITTPGTDWLWDGLKNLKGRVTMRGIGRSMREITADFEGIDSREKEFGLTGALADRLLMWYGRDPNDRADFNAMYEDCEIAAMDEAGGFSIKGRRNQKILTRDGRYVGEAYSGGRKSSFTFQKIGEHMVCTKVEADLDDGVAKWTESVKMGFTTVGGYLLPNRLHFEKIFAPDWGPETIVFTDIVVEPAK